MTREQMIEKAFLAIWSGCEGSRSQSELEARLVVDALLPQVTTVEELEALPPRTVVIDAAGVPYERFRRSWGTTGDDYTYTSGAILTGHGPLTVVWQP